jgi:hypothetical protein
MTKRGLTLDAQAGLQPTVRPEICLPVDDQHDRIGAIPSVGAALNPHAAKGCRYRIPLPVGTRSAMDPSRNLDDAHL